MIALSMYCTTRSYLSPGLSPAFLLQPQRGLLRQGQKARLTTRMKDFMEKMEGCRESLKQNSALSFPSSSTKGLYNLNEV
ncbi:hypothetical protein BDV09DRAFT_168508 [Aspergillus tetrazonus]